MTELKAGYDGTLYVLDAAAPYQLASGAWAKIGTNLQTARGIPADPRVSGQRLPSTGHQQPE